MPMIELDEVFEKECLDDIRRAAEYLRDKMDEVLKNVGDDPSRINGNGEVQGLGLRVDVACARYGLLRRLAHGAGKAKDGRPTNEGKSARIPRHRQHGHSTTR